MAHFVNGPEAEGNVKDDLDILLEDEDSDDSSIDSEDNVPDDDESKDDESDEDSDDTGPEDDEDSEEDSEEDEEESDKEEDTEDDKQKVGAPFANRPTHGQLKKEFPDLFKKFPGLKDSFFREAEFTKRFPTVKDADEAIEQLTILQEGEQKISTGDPAVLLEMLGDYDKNAEKKFIANFLPTVFNKNREAFMAITYPVLKNVLRSAINKGKNTGNENLENSALHIHEFIFGDVDVEKALPDPRAVLVKEKDPEQAKFENEKKQFFETREREFVESVVSTGRRGIDKVIEGSIPESFSELEKEAYGDRIRKHLATALSEDTAHISVMNRIRKEASKAGFSKQFIDRASSTYLSRAKLALPAIIKEVKSQALKGKPKASNTPKRATANHSAPPKRGEKVTKDREALVRSGKMTELDFLKS